MGINLFHGAVKEGTERNDIAYLIAYARYLNNGGTPKGWKEMTFSDIALMNIYDTAHKEMLLEAQSIYIANAIGKLFGGKE